MRTILLTHERRPQVALEYQRYSTTYYPYRKAGALLELAGIADQPARYLALIRTFQEVESLVETKFIEITKPRNISE